MLRNFAIDIVLEDALSFWADGVVVEGEMRHAEQMIQFQKF